MSGSDEEFDDYMDSIFDYYNEIGFDITVVDSEVPFYQLKRIIIVLMELLI
ncbi:MAG: hypothetical protein V8S94_06795 [Methanobrevibacter smithii]